MYQLFDNITDISVEPVSSDDQERVMSNMKELDQYLGPYPYERYFFLHMISIVKALRSKCYNYYASLRRRGGILPCTCQLVGQSVGHEK